MILPLAMLHPRGEVPHLAVVTIVSKPHLRTDEEDLLVVDDNATVVDYVLVYDRHSEITKDIHCVFTRKNFGENFPGV